MLQIRHGEGRIFIKRGTFMKVKRHAGQAFCFFVSIHFEFLLLSGNCSQKYCQSKVHFDNPARHHPNISITKQSPSYSQLFHNCGHFCVLYPQFLLRNTETRNKKSFITTTLLRKPWGLVLASILGCWFKIPDYFWIPSYISLFFFLSHHWAVTC